MSIYKNEEACRASGSPNLETIIEFGETPLADRLLTENQLGDPELKAPLTLVFCPDSALVQIRETVDPEIIVLRGVSLFFLRVALLAAPFSRECAGYYGAQRAG